MAKIRALFGADGQFVLLPNRPYWLPVNDADYDNAPKLGEFVLHDEAFYPIDGYVDFQLPGNVKIFTEESRRLEQQRLEILALEALAKNLKAAQAEYDLETLIGKIDLYLKQEDEFNR